MNERTRNEILAEVNELADDIQEIAPVTSRDEAMAIVWEGVPELYDEYTAAPAESLAAPIAKSEPEPTLGETIMLAVSKRAGELAWTRWPTSTIQDIEHQVWTSDEGKVLYELYRSDQSKLPYQTARFQKSARQQDAWSILARWLA